jgi:hypothetical protein
MQPQECLYVPAANIQVAAASLRQKHEETAQNHAMLGA